MKAYTSVLEEKDHWGTLLGCMNKNHSCPSLDMGPCREEEGVSAMEALSLMVTVHIKLLVHAFLQLAFFLVSQLCPQ